METMAFTIPPHRAAWVLSQVIGGPLASLSFDRYIWEKTVAYLTKDGQRDPDEAKNLLMLLSNDWDHRNDAINLNPEMWILDIEVLDEIVQFTTPTGVYVGVSAFQEGEVKVEINFYRDSSYLATQIACRLVLTSDTPYNRTVAIEALTSKGE